MLMRWIPTKWRIQLKVSYMLKGIPDYPLSEHVFEKVQIGHFCTLVRIPMFAGRSLVTVTLVSTTYKSDYFFWECKEPRQVLKRENALIQTDSFKCFLTQVKCYYCIGKIYTTDFITKSTNMYYPKGIKNGFLSYQISEMLPYTLHGFRIYMIKNVLFMIKLYFKIIDTFFFDNVDPIVLQIIQCSVNYKCFSGK